MINYPRRKRFSLYSLIYGILRRYTVNEATSPLAPSPPTRVPFFIRLSPHISIICVGMRKKSRYLKKFLYSTSGMGSIFSCPMRIGVRIMMWSWSGTKIRNSSDAWSRDRSVLLSGYPRLYLFFTVQVGSVGELLLLCHCDLYDHIGILKSMFETFIAWICSYLRPRMSVDGEIRCLHVDNTAKSRN